MEIPNLKIKEFFGDLQEYFEQGKNASFFGICLNDLTRDELLIVCAYALKQIRNQDENFNRTLDFIQDLHDARR